MSSQQSFDLVVIGTGVAAGTVVSKVSSAGLKIAIVDERPFGGTCQLRGCDPKKILRRSAEIIDAARLLHGRGIARAGALAIDWPALINFKREFTDPVPEQREKPWREQGIATFHDHAAFVDERTLSIGDTRVHAKKIVLAVGAKPMPLPIEGAGYLIHSDDFMELETLPRRLVFVGGGYISFEFAHIAARAGADVTLLEMSERPLTPFDPDLVARLVERSRAIGIDIRTHAQVEAIEKQGARFSVRARIDNKPCMFEADGVVHGAGRVPATEGLELERGGVQCSKRGIEVNEYLQSVSNPAVYAAGDASATEGPPLTPVANLEGSAIGHNLLNGNSKAVDYRGVPSCAFTVPPLASVGLTEAAAKEQGIDYDCKLIDMSGWYLARRVGETCAAAKIMIGKDKRIVGAHLLGPECEQIINFFGIAIRKGWSSDELAGVVSAYPSAASYVGSLVAAG